MLSIGGGEVVVRIGGREVVVRLPIYIVLATYFQNQYSTLSTDPWDWSKSCDDFNTEKTTISGPGLVGTPILWAIVIYTMKQIDDLFFFVPMFVLMDVSISRSFW